MTAYCEVTFEALRARDPRMALQYAGRARGLFTRRGLEVPAWAAVALLPRARPPAEAAATPLVIPPELRAWRSASSTRGFSLSLDGRVQLIDWQNGPVEARLPSVAGALAAIAANAVRW